MSTDMSCFPYYPNPEEKEWKGFGVHRGFFNRVHNQYFEIVEILRDKKKFPELEKIYVTGHSLGGALAQVFYLIYNSPNEFSQEAAALKPAADFKADKVDEEDRGEDDKLCELKNNLASETKHLQVAQPKNPTKFCPCECITFASPQVIYYEVKKSQPIRANRFYTIQNSLFEKNYNFVYHNDIVPQGPLRAKYLSFLESAVQNAYETQTDELGFFMKPLVASGYFLLNKTGAINSFLGVMHSNLSLLSKHYKVAGNTIRLGTEPNAKIQDGLVKNVDMTSYWDSEKDLPVSLDDHFTVNYVRAVKKFAAQPVTAPHETLLPPLSPPKKKGWFF